MQDYYTATFFELLAELGITADQLLDQAAGAHHTARAPHMEGADRNSATVTTEQSEAVVRRALELSDDPQLGLRHGARLNLPSQGIFGYALMSSATVADALKLLVRYNRVIMPNIGIELKQCDGDAELIMQASHLPQNLEQFYCEVLFAAVLSNGSLLQGEQNGVVGVELDYAPQKNLQLYEEILGPNVRFNCQRKALHFGQDILTARIATANSIAGDIFRRECDRLFSPDIRRGPIVERVQQELIQSGSDFANCAAMARRLHMSESTLQRRLKREGSSYQKVLDQVRYGLAREYLTDTLLPVAEIAHLLGFSDSTNFRRSFRRWSYTTPSEFRLQAG